MELGYFKKGRSECESFLDRWCWCLKHIYRLMELPEELAGEIFTKLFEACEIAQFPQGKYLKYESDMMTLRDYKHDLYFSNKEGFEKGMKIGAEKREKQFLEAMRRQGYTEEQIEAVMSAMA